MPSTVLARLVDDSQMLVAMSVLKYDSNMIYGLIAMCMEENESRRA